MPSLQLNVLDPRGVRDLAPVLLDEKGLLKVVPAQTLQQTTVQERALFGVKHAHYVLPTEELVTRLQTLIGGRSAIEIGSGNGVLAAALGIPATDNHHQSWPEVKEYYDALRQPVVSYGENVERLDALAAVKKYRPEVIVAAWVTHKYDPSHHWAGGNENGVDELQVLDRCKAYVFVGNEKVHANKPIWGLTHTIEYPDYVFSRATNGSRDFIAVWQGHG